MEKTFRCFRWSLYQNMIYKDLDLYVMLFDLLDPPHYKEKQERLIYASNHAIKKRLKNKPSFTIDLEDYVSMKEGVLIFCDNLKKHTNPTIKNFKIKFEITNGLKMALFSLVNEIKNKTSCEKCIFYSKHLITGGCEEIFTINQLCKNT